MREEIEGRPLVTLAIGLIIGLVAVQLPASLILLLGCVFWLRNLQPRLTVAISFGVGLLIAPQPVQSLLEDTPIHSVGTISSVPKLYPFGQSFEVQLDGRTIVYTTPREARLSIGDQIEVSGIEHPISVVGSDYAMILGVSGRMESDHVRVLRKGSWLGHVASMWRKSFVELSSSNLSDRSSALLDAVCFNTGSLVDSETRQEMKRSGLIHIVTASGMQVFVLGFLLNALLRFFPVPRWLQILCLTLVLAFYCLAAGLNPAIVRASVMTVLGLSAYLVRRDPDALSALALTSILYLLWNPHSVFSAGFQMSMVAVTAIVLFVGRTRNDTQSIKSKVISLTNEYLKGSLVLMLATFPLAAYYFGAVSIVSLLSNLLVCWCLPLLFALSMTAFSVSLFMPSMGNEMLAKLASPFVDWIQMVLDWTGGSESTLSLPAFSGYWLIGFYFLWSLTYRRRVVQP